MQLVNLDQRTPEWFVWRQHGITASETPVILGLSPYKTPWRLWMEKTGKIKPDDLSRNPNVQRGVEMEDDVRKLFEEERLEIVEPACGVCDEDPVFRASFDGLDSKGRPVEIKCPSRKVWDEILANGESADTYRLYAAQVQHQLLVSGANEGFLVFYSEGEMKIFDIKRDEAFIRRIRDEGRKFFDSLQAGKPPKKDPEKDLYVPESEEDVTRWVQAARQFLRYQKELDELEEKTAAVKRELAALRPVFQSLMGDNAVADFAGVEVRRSSVKGRIDYQKALEATAGKMDPAELEKFRSEPTERWSIRPSGSDLPKQFVEDDGLLDTIASVPDERRWF